jgi:hypothetical protein
MWRNVRRKVFARAAHYYKVCAILFCNTLVLFVLINAILFVVFKVKDSLPRSQAAHVDEDDLNPIFKAYGKDTLAKVYPNYSEDDIRVLLDETWCRRFVYDPVCQIKERVYSGKWVNVDKNRLRLSKNNGPWPPDKKNLNVFLFGGSHTFGYGEADQQTIASHLQDFLQGHSERGVKVYNFGAGCYYSTQERALFSDCLVQGFVPAVAVFIDGLNDFIFWNVEPLYTSRLREFMEAPEPKQVAGTRELLSALPMTRLVNSLRPRPKVRPEAQEIIEESEWDNDEQGVAYVIKRYAQNKRMIEAVARAYAVPALFVWQPGPAYKYDLKYHLFYKEKAVRQNAHCRVGYPVMARTVKENAEEYGKNFLWLADIQEDFKEPLYVDSSHYTGKFNKEVARHVGKFLLEREPWLDGRTGKSSQSASQQRSSESR